MNVAKDWALTIMLKALAFAHFSSELLLKEQMIISVKKTLNNAGHIDAKLIDISEICQKKSSEIGSFLLIVSWRSFPLKFPAKSVDFSANFDFSPAKIPQNRPIFRNFWLFSRENPAKSVDFSANLPRKIARNFAFFSAKYQKPCYEQCPFFLSRSRKTCDTWKWPRTWLKTRDGRGAAAHRKRMKVWITQIWSI